MTRLHIVIPALFLIALTSCIAAADSYSGQSPSQGIATQQAAATATPLPPFPPSLTPDATEMSPTDPSPTDPSPTHTPAPTNTPTNTPAPPTNTPVPR